MTVKNKPKYTKIIEAAIDVIAENGYHHAQVSKIAKKAGVADGTIYIYFQNKEDILVSLFDQKMGDFIEKTRSELAGIEDVTTKFITLVERHFSHLASNYSLAIVTQLELRQSNTAIRLKINDILKEYLRLIDGIIETGKANQTFAPELNTRLARQMIFGTLDETVTNWVMNEQKYDLVTLARPVAELLLNGLSR